jgi:hypothetical protein
MNPGGTGNGPAGIKLMLGGTGNGPAGINPGGTGRGPAGIAFAEQAVTTRSERMTTLITFNVRMENSPGGDNPPKPMQIKSTPNCVEKLTPKNYFPLK